LREIKMVLPFGIKREREPKKKKKLPDLYTHFYADKVEDVEWRPTLKPMGPTREDQVAYKPALFVLRYDPSDKKVMYLEQDLMAKTITKTIDKKSGFTYRLQDDRNVVVRRYLALVDENKLVDLVKEFVVECNRILYLYCDTQ
jgi:sulfur transfer complex TusBCD TusB component (DsrH family)